MEYVLYGLTDHLQGRIVVLIQYVSEKPGEHITLKVKGIGTSGLVPPYQEIVLSYRPYDASDIPLLLSVTEQGLKHLLELQRTSITRIPLRQRRTE